MAAMRSGASGPLVLRGLDLVCAAGFLGMGRMALGVAGNRLRRFVQLLKETVGRVTWTVRIARRKRLSGSTLVAGNSSSGEDSVLDAQAAVLHLWKNAGAVEDAVQEDQAIAKIERGGPELLL